MSYSKVKKNGFPDLGIYQNAYHVVREADLLSAYDFDRAIIYDMKANNKPFDQSYDHAQKLFDKWNPVIPGQTLIKYMDAIKGKQTQTPPAGWFGSEQKQTKDELGDTPENRQKFKDVILKTIQFAVQKSLNNIRKEQLKEQSFLSMISNGFSLVTDYYNKKTFKHDITDSKLAKNIKHGVYSTTQASAVIN